jgi:energy-coupling factor transporter ATP-binding protein EcfA2
MLYYFPFHTHKDFAKSVYDEIAYGFRTLGIGEEVRKRVEVVVRTVGLLALLDEGPSSCSRNHCRIMLCYGFLLCHRSPL